MLCDRRQLDMHEAGLIGTLAVSAVHALDLVIACRLYHVLPTACVANSLDLNTKTCHHQ